MDSNELLIKSLNRQQVLVKTDKGWREIQTKDLKLSAKLRRLLIMIDGKSSVGDILDRLSMLGGDLEAQIMTLMAEGFVAPNSGVRASEGRGARQTSQASTPAH